MKQLLAALLLLGTLFVPLDGEAQQSQDFGDYVVHYNALNTNLIPPQVAKGYGIQRSSNRALLNVTVLKKVMDTPGTPVAAQISASGTNLTGQVREIDLRKVEEAEGAIYYLGVFPVHNLETYRFNVEVSIEGEAEPLVVKFKQQFYTE
jgi:IMP cyclohydrolase